MPQAHRRVETVMIEPESRPTRQYPEALVGSPSSRPPSTSPTRPAMIEPVKRAVLRRVRKGTEVVSSAARAE